MEQNIFKEDILEREKNLTILLSRENETYAKLELSNGKQTLYVKGTWYPTHFMMFVLDGQNTWDINGMLKLDYSKIYSFGVIFLINLYTYFKIFKF